MSLSTLEDCSNCAEVGVSVALLLFARKANTQCAEDIIKTMTATDPYTNYFFKCAEKPYFGLAVVDNAFVRMVHAQLAPMPCNVYWGRNTDPVEFVPLKDVVKLLDTKNVCKQ